VDAVKLERLLPVEPTAARAAAIGGCAPSCCAWRTPSAPGWRAGTAQPPASVRTSCAAWPRCTAATASRCGRSRSSGTPRESFRIRRLAQCSRATDAALDATGLGRD
jgi:hypothetical protein